MSRKSLSDGEDMIPVPESSEDENEESVHAGSDDEELSLDPFLESDSDSDSAPEAISFQSAKKSVSSAQKRAADVIRLQKEDRKKKRTELHFQNLQQRKEKLKKIQSKRLPEDFLATLNDDEPEPVTENHEQDSTDSKLKMKPESETTEVHGKTMFVCKRLPQKLKKIGCAPPEVANFKENVLFGSRIKREKSYHRTALKKEKARMRK